MDDIETFDFDDDEELEDENLDDETEKEKEEDEKEEESLNKNENVMPEEQNVMPINQYANPYGYMQNNMMGQVNQMDQSEMMKASLLNGREALPNEVGVVTDISEDKVIVSFTTDYAKENTLSDRHVIFLTGNQRIVGTVITVSASEASVRLIGEISGGRFVPGVLTKPSMQNVCLAATDEEIKLIVADDRQGIAKKVLIGTMPLYNNEPVYVPTNSFFSNHFAIFGNTGSGKSCGVSRLLQNVFFYQTPAPKNACMFIFDAYGEYESALSIQNSQIYFKRYTTNVKDTTKELIKLPLWLLEPDDYALLLEADDPTQIPIIEKALRLVTIFSGDESETRVYKNDIIAKAILEVLYSGGSAAQIHDQVFAILTSFNTPDLNLDSQIVQPGYTRTLRQCMIIDKEGKINEMQLVSEFISKYTDPNLKLELPDGTVPYTLDNLREAFEFALISEGTLKSNKAYEKANVLKVRLESIIKGEYAEYFKVDRYISRNDFIKSLITASNGGRAQIINFNISYIDDRLAKTIVKIYSRILFDFTSQLEKRGSFPVHILLEEAHRYVQNDSDVNILGYNIFDRIAKEGRKYGVILGMISQRPSELSETALSQCSNFLIFKMQHPHDVQFIKQMVPFITDEIIEKLKGLQPGTCVVFGLAFKLPQIVKMEMPNPSPLSQNVDVSQLWY